ncbi:hypothetical protein [Chitinophaga barathri]|uniref:Uncharacterized protein n=1 Tax=Chitinophaga barathri TaxID=1647451 RepID=A0A3N4MDQ7_9BACT|nr:hypothetical protein [Chitinophaga barathri]RPD38240.1 hypothetical protein EG028_25420 [Chitinophaga barathri]
MRVIILLTCLCCTQLLSAQTKTIHVLVALCDNQYQGIVKVPARIGNGQDPANNLYWGCGYGVKTFLKKQPDWKLLRTIANPSANIYERLVFKHTGKDCYLVADAYNGAYMKQTVSTFLDYAAGKQSFTLGEPAIPAGGGSQLICFVGHNGLMDFQLTQTPSPVNNRPRQAAIFACASKPYFYEALKKTGAQPLIWTTHLLSPEAYTLDAMVDAWLLNETAASIREKVAQAYNKYQHCGIKGARNLFATGW